MTAKKKEKYLVVAITIRPDQAEKVRTLQALRKMSAVCQEAIDAAPK